jgi:hypothetical protein
MHPSHRAARLLQLLARDPRTNVLDVQVRIVDNRLFLSGNVESEILRTSVEQVIREAIPRNMEIVNNIWVTAYVP